MRRIAPLLLAVVLGMPAGGPASGDEAAPPRLLVVTTVVAKGYRHESIPLIVSLLDRLGRDSRLFTTDRADTEAELLAKTTPDSLKAYSGIVFANSDGDLPLADRDAFLAWLESGGAVVGIHGAAVTLRTWPAFVALLGGEFDYHREQAKVEVRVLDPMHPATEGLASPFDLFDEIYLYKSFDRSRVNVLLALDRHPNTGEPGFYPLAWTREQGKGRVFYTGPGHRDDVVQAAWFARHLHGGIRWALRR